MMQSKVKFCYCLLKLILNVCSEAPKLPLISSVGPSPNTKKLFVWDDELLSTPKIITVLAKP